MWDSGHLLPLTQNVRLLTHLLLGLCLWSASWLRPAVRLDRSPSPRTTQLFLLRPHRHLCHIPAKKTLHLFRALSTQGRLGFRVTQGLQGLHLVSDRPRAGHSRRQPQGELLFSQDTGMLIGPFDHCVVCRTEPVRETWRGRWGNTGSGEGWSMVLNRDPAHSPWDSGSCPFLRGGSARR